MNIAMIPARLGSQRLKQKNLCELNGISLVAHAIRKCQAADCFDEIWLNSESNTLGEIALAEGAQFHKRPDELADHTTTSEQFVYEFLQHHPCDTLFQVHTIAPLLGADRIQEFVAAMNKQKNDTLLSCTHEQIECAYQGQPINFSFDAKSNSQDLAPIQRITWGITGWKCATFMKTYESGNTSTYSGTVGFFPISRTEGHIIKTEEDLQLAELYLTLTKNS